MILTLKDEAVFSHGGENPARQCVGAIMLLRRIFFIYGSSGKEAFLSSSLPGRLFAASLPNNID
jgi:hypothetical protein